MMGQAYRYFNAAGHGVPLTAVYERMAEFIRSEADMGSDKAAEAWQEAIFKVRKSAASLLGGAEDQVGFFGTITNAWLAILSRMDLAGKRVLVAPHEWGDYYRALGLRGDVTIEVLPELDLDNPDLSAWAAQMGEDVAALFVPMVTSVCGVEYPVAQIGAMPRPKGCKYIVDAAQALGQMKVDVKQIGCDALFSTTRKWLRGPRQTSLVWLGDSWASSGREIEAADQNLALRLGLGVAIDHVLDVDVEAVQADILVRSDKIRHWARTRGLPVVNGHTGSVSIKVADTAVSGLNDTLLAHDIYAKIPKAVFFEPVSGVGPTECNVLRISPHVYTTDEHMGALFKALGNGFGVP